jgi:hypothetical protein
LSDAGRAFVVAAVAAASSFDDCFCASCRIADCFAAASAAAFAASAGLAPFFIAFFDASFAAFSICFC